MTYGTAKQARSFGQTEAEVGSLLALRAAFEGLRPRPPAVRGFWPDMDFEPAPVFARVAVPTLLFYGEDDEWSVDASVAAWNGRGRTVIRLRGTAHAPTLRGERDPSSVAPDYTDTLVAWLRRVTAR